MRSLTLAALAAFAPVLILTLLAFGSLCATVGFARGFASSLALASTAASLSAPFAFPLPLLRCLYEAVLLK